MIPDKEPDILSLVSSDWAELGLLTGPMIHDLRNDLNVISLQVNILRRKLPDALKPSLDVVTRAVSQAAASLEFVRGRREEIVADPTTLDLASLVRETAASFVTDGEAGVELELDVPESAVFTIRGPFETSRWMRLATHHALLMADPAKDRVVIRLSDASLCWVVTDQPLDPSRRERFVVSRPRDLHPLEVALLELIPHRVGLHVEGQLAKGSIRVMLDPSRRP